MRICMGHMVSLHAYDVNHELFVLTAVHLNWVVIELKLGYFRSFYNATCMFGQREVQSLKRSRYWIKARRKFSESRRSRCTRWFLWRRIKSRTRSPSLPINFRNARSVKVFYPVPINMKGFQVDAGSMTL